MKTPMQEMLEWVRATLPMDLEKEEGKSTYRLKGWKWEKAIDEKHNQEINETMDLMLKVAQDRQDKNNRLFWRALQQYIEMIWD